LIDLKNATIAAFSRQPATQNSPTDSFVCAAEVQNSTPQRPQLGQRAATTGVVDEKHNKAERILGEAFTSSPVVHDFALAEPSKSAPSQSNIEHWDAPSPGKS